MLPRGSLDPRVGKEIEIPRMKKILSLRSCFSVMLTTIQEKLRARGYWPNDIIIHKGEGEAEGMSREHSLRMKEIRDTGSWIVIAY